MSRNTKVVKERKQLLGGLFDARRRPVACSYFRKGAGLIKEYGFTVRSPSKEPI